MAVMTRRQAAARGLDVLESDYAPIGSGYIVGRSLVLHPLDLIAQRAKSIDHRLELVRAWFDRDTALRLARAAERL